MHYSRKQLKGCTLKKHYSFMQLKGGTLKTFICLTCHCPHIPSAAPCEEALQTKDVGRKGNAAAAPAKENTKPVPAKHRARCVLGGKPGT